MGSTEYVITAVQVALSSDVGSPRAMTSPVYSTEQVDNSFDYVIYEKGKVVCRVVKTSLNEIKLCSNLRTQSIRPSLLNGPKNFFPQATTTFGLHFYFPNGPEEYFSVKMNNI